MSHVALFGGGRWARVISSVLVADGRRVRLHTRGGLADTQRWVREGGLEEQVSIDARWPTVAPSAAIVANAARDHVPAAEHALALGCPTLVEKPFAATVEGAARLRELVAAGAPLATAHVFSFASYLRALRSELEPIRPLKRIQLEWADPPVEQRYGETKRHDTSLTVLEDVFPHVYSILSPLVDRQPLVCRSAHVAPDGSHCEVELRAGETVCEATLSRGLAAARTRRLLVGGASGQAELNFSTEPGLLTLRERTAPPVDDWETAPRPLLTMLRTFLRWAEGGPRDPRLAPELGLDSFELVQAALKLSAAR